jgi:LysM repeat protein
LVAALLLAACDITISAPTLPAGSPTDQPNPTATPLATATDTATATPLPTETPLVASPTPDPSRPRDPNLDLLGPNWAAFSHKVQAGDEVGTLAARYGLTYDQIRIANGFKGGEVLQPGQVILIPQEIQQKSPTRKLIPDSELVYGPSTIGFDVDTFVAKYKRGYLYSYTETVNGEELSGATLIQRAAQSYSLNPRLLLALLEYQSNWLTAAAPETNAKLYPFGRAEGGTEGLLRQLGWVANALNQGYYEWNDYSLSLLILGDGTRVGLSDGLNAGTVALDYVFSQTTTDLDQWESTLAVSGFSRTYQRLFGDPFAHAVEPLVPTTLTQPDLTLPWQGGETWFYSGGPHGSFGSGSPWGAVDFLPPGNASGCDVSANWITAIAPGVVARSGDGQLLLDLDGDGDEQTGWVILYLHVAEQDRPTVGTVLGVGDKVGHPSCEGGFAKDAHVHVARKYNGVWLRADDPLAPFVLGGYTLKSTGSEYNGLMEGFGVAKLACACRNESNAITK